MIKGFTSSTESQATVSSDTIVVFDNITDFASESDKISLDQAGSIDFASGASASVTTAAVANVATFVDLEAAIEAVIGSLAASSSSNAKVYDVTLSGNGLAAAGVEHLVIVNDGDDALSTSDLMIELSGTSSNTILSGDFVFTA